MNPRTIIVSWDFLTSAVVTAVFGYWLPQEVPSELAKDYYGVGISVLSIVFSLFFAALAVIIAASDDEFVLFLDVEGDHTALINNYAFTLRLLFGALVYSLGFYAYTAERISADLRHQHKYFLVGFCFLFLWSLFASFKSTFDSIKYSTYRKKFIKAQREPSSQRPNR